MRVLFVYANNNQLGTSSGSGDWFVTYEQVKQIGEAAFCHLDSGGGPVPLAASDDAPTWAPAFFAVVQLNDHPNRRPPGHRRDTVRKGTP